VIYFLHASSWLSLDDAMKSCTHCQTTYPENVVFCPRDGTALRSLNPWSERALIRGKYFLLCKVGQGGMGAVYKALHLVFDELRALKVINEEFARDEAFVKRFKHEAVLARKLQHPNAVRVDDIDESEDGRAFIVMEFIEGPSLKSLVETQGALAPERVCSMARQVASALEAAHGLGMVHRDIKPANIVLVPTGDGEQAKVLDFGIAKLKESRVGSPSGSTLTSAGMVIGTPQYMSPEQALGKRGDELDGRSDLYSLGVVMYQMLTASLPFKADTSLQMLMDHIHTPPKPIQQARPDLQIPDSLARLVMKCLEKRPELRPPTAQALIEELDAVEAEIRGMGAARPAPAAPQAEALGETLLGETWLAREGGGQAAERDPLWVGEAPSEIEIAPHPAPRARAEQLTRSKRHAGLIAVLALICLGVGAGLYYGLTGQNSPRHSVNTGPVVSMHESSKPQQAPPRSQPTIGASRNSPNRAGSAAASPASASSFSPAEVAENNQPSGPQNPEKHPPELSPGQQRVATLIQQGDHYFREADYRMAEREYAAGLDLDPQNTSLLAKLRDARSLADFSNPAAQSDAAQPSSAAPSPPAETTGSIRVLSKVGAQVYMDNSTNLAGTVGSDGSLFIPNLNAGRHKMRVVLPGYRDWNGTVNVESGVTGITTVFPQSPNQ
jgi:eukaryotic-like serine/threonine-protein kinase